MFKIKMADFVIEIDNKYDFIYNMCKEYLTDSEKVDICIGCTESDIEAEAQIAEGEFSNGYLESICIYRNLCTMLPLRDAFLVHCAVIEVDGYAYAFLAKSGTGKSTHISLWRKVFGDRVRIINGDKPIFRYVDGELYAYGTPWCGKEGWQRNTKAPIGALCFLTRATENYIRPLSPSDCVSMIMKQILMPQGANEAIKTLELVDRMLRDKKSWLLGCNISDEAATVAYNAMTKREE